MIHHVPSIFTMSHSCKKEEYINLEATLKQLIIIKVSKMWQHSTQKQKSRKFCLRKLWTSLEQVAFLLISGISIFSARIRHHTILLELHIKNVKYFAHTYTTSITSVAIDANVLDFTTNRFVVRMQWIQFRHPHLQHGIVIPASLVIWTGYLPLHGSFT